MVNFKNIFKSNYETYHYKNSIPDCQLFNLNVAWPRL